MDKDWIALRCSGSKTGALALALKLLDLSAWTPIVVREIRVPRKTVKRPVEMPLLPTFVFILVSELEAAEKARLYSKCPAFTPMKFMSSLATFSSNQLDHLRKVSELAPAEVKKIKFPEAGARVLIKVGAFDGLRATVRGRTKTESILQLDDSTLEVKIPPFLFQVLER